jgi:protein-disulfide isomerase
MDTFTADVAGKTTAQKINFDLALGKSVGVSATPTFFLNGEKLDDETASGMVQGNLDAIKKKLDAAIKQNQ